MAASCLVPNSRVVIEKISLNESRIGFIRVLERMGANISFKIESGGSRDSEPVGTVTVESSQLKGVHVKASEIPALIDEIPLLAVLASQASGITDVDGAEELRVKESDRLEAVATNLRSMGCVIETKQDGFIIKGKQELKGAKIETFHDHRIAMAFSVAGLVAQGETLIQGAECVAVSYPGFYEALNQLRKE